VMMKDIVAARPVGGYRLRIRFDDGVEGEVDVAELVDFVGVFSPLRDRQEFLKVTVDAETGTICWPNGADLDPIVLYAKVTDTSVDEVLAAQAKVAR
jgi:hypothetical protein